MEPTPEKPAQPVPLAQKKTIQPLNPEAVKAEAASQQPRQPSPQSQMQTTTTSIGKSPTPPGAESAYPTPSTGVANAQTAATPQSKKPDWKPNTSLSSRLPRLRIWGCVYIVIGIFNTLSASRALSQSSSTVRNIIIGLSLIPVLWGAILILSKSKMLVLATLNTVLGLAIVLAIFSLLSFFIIGVIAWGICIGSVISMKKSVKALA